MHNDTRCIARLVKRRDAPEAFDLRSMDDYECAHWAPRPRDNRYTPTDRQAFVRGDCFRLIGSRRYRSTRDTLRRYRRSRYDANVSSTSIYMLFIYSFKTYKTANIFYIRTLKYLNCLSVIGFLSQSLRSKWFEMTNNNKIIYINIF